MPAELILIRHGQSQANVGLSSDPDSPLTELGIRQSQEVAAQVASHDLRAFTCFTSPYQRARQTAQIIAAATGITFTVIDAIREWGPDATISGASYPQEPIAHVVTRLRNFLSFHLAQNLLLVTHATPIALLTELAKNQPPTITGPFWEGIENCCLRSVDVITAQSPDPIAFRQIIGQHAPTSELIKNLAHVFLEARNPIFSFQSTFTRSRKISDI